MDNVYDKYVAIGFDIIVDEIDLHRVGFMISLIDNNLFMHYVINQSQLIILKNVLKKSKALLMNIKSSFLILLPLPYNRSCN
jgi:hypothetical protein